MVVWCIKSAGRSCCFAVVIVQQSADAFAPSNSDVRAGWWHLSRQQPVAQPLVVSLVVVSLVVVSLVVVVLDVLADNEAQRSVAKLVTKDPVFLSQIADRVLLTTIEPTGHGQSDELQCRGHPPRPPR